MLKISVTCRSEIFIRVIINKIKINLNICRQTKFCGRFLNRFSLDDSVKTTLNTINKFPLLERRRAERKWMRMGEAK